MSISPEQVPASSKKKARKQSKFIYWTPRILSIIFILFLALMSLDVFGNGYTFWQTVVGLFMHNIPVFILLILLLIAWKREIVGAVVFIAFGISYMVRIIMTMITNGFQWYYLSWIVQIAGIAFFIGILFLIGWKKRKG